MIGWILRVLLGLIAAGNLAWAAVSIFDPLWAADLVGLDPSGAPAAIGELRAIYGGLVGSIGVVLALAVLRRPLKAWYGALAIIFLGLVSGRVVSLAVDGYDAFTLLALLLEAFTVLLLLAACRWAPEPRTPEPGEGRP
jgi:hypothetical protein